MEYARGRMTAGLPGLLPDKRRRLDTVMRTRDTDGRNLQEQYLRDFETTAPDNGRSTTSLEQQLGRPLTSRQVIDRLKRMNPRLHFEPSLSDSTKMGIYLPVEGSKRFICGMERGYMPEFSVRHAEEVEIPSPDLDGTKKKVNRIVRETRGWRTVLARLIRAGLVRIPDCERNFNFSHDSANWKGLTT